LQKALKAQRKKARKLVKVFVISSGGSIHKSHRDFFFMGKKTEVKEMVRGRKLEVVLKNLGFFW